MKCGACKAETPAAFLGAGGVMLCAPCYGHGPEVERHRKDALAAAVAHTTNLAEKLGGEFCDPWLIVHNEDGTERLVMGPCALEVEVNDRGVSLRHLRRPGRGPDGKWRRAKRSAKSFPHTHRKYANAENLHHPLTGHLADLNLDAEAAVWLEPARAWLRSLHG